MTVDRSGRGPLSLAEVGQTLLTVAEHARMGVLITWIDEQRAELIYLNDAAVELLGRTPDELTTMNLIDTVAASDRARVDELIRQILGGEQVEPHIEMTIAHPSGREVPLLVTFAPVTHEGRFLTVNLMFDISERKRLERQLAHADRLAALGTMAAGVAHEINNPLASISLNLENVARYVEGELAAGSGRDRVMQVLGEVQTSVERVAAIVRDLGTFSREQAVAEVAIDVPSVVAAAERLVTHEVRHRARIEVALGALPPVKASAQRLEQVFVNLLLNAAQAFAAAAPSNLIRVVGSVQDDGLACIAVSDNGPGIPPDVLGRIFDPFFTTKPVGSGMGLGLSICHGIVTRFGGTLTVESTVGVGTTFRIVLPVASTRPRPTVPPLAVPHEPVPRMRVLIVDDEPLIGRALGALLYGIHDIDVVTSGPAALERIQATTYDVILCDLMMPGVDGVDVYDELVRRGSGLERRVVFMTGGAVTERGHQFLARIPNVRLAKPFNSQALERALRDVPR